MEIQLVPTPAHEVAADWLILPFRPHSGPATAKALFQQLDDQGDLETDCGSVSVSLTCDEIAARRVCFVGFGDESDDVRDVNSPIQGALFRVLEKGPDTVAFVLPDGVEPEAAIECIVRCAHVAGVGQAVYQSDCKRACPEKLIIVAPDVADSPDLQAAVDRGNVIGESLNTVRDLVNRDAYEINPVSFAERASAAAESVGLQCEVYDDAWLEGERFGSMLAVARGSEHPARLVVLRYQGADADAESLGLCGKGVTFDSGGLSLKPSNSMTAMKADMAGGATVLGIMLALARLKPKVNVIGAIGLVENMISGDSYRLGDVLTSRNGTTIEIHNTDAEGRLVLADVLSWTVDQGATRLIDFATLTGACVVALGEHITGLFPNDDAWAAQILDAAEDVGEDVWQLPMHEAFNEQLKSDVADCKNVGTRWGGATTAAKFLEKFVGGTTWAHLDIAGPAFATSSSSGRDGGATGAMLQTIVRLVCQTSS